MKKTEFLLIVFLFIFGSVCGWILEVFYRRIPSRKNPNGKWLNPGLLTGPWLPIYGFGTIFLYFATSLENVITVKGFGYVIILYFGSAVVMSGLELVGGSLLYNLLHMRLWDYREEKFNYKGYICLKFFNIWGLVSVIYYYFISKPLVNITQRYLSNVDIFAYFVGILWGFFILDLWNSMGVSAKLAKYAKENNIVIDFEKVKDEARDNPPADINAKKDNFFFVPRKDTIISFVESSRKRIESIPTTLNEIKDKVEDQEKKLKDILKNKA